MEGNKTKNRRRFSRCLTQLKARYCLNERRKDWKECAIFNISRSGVGVKFYSGEKISIGSTVHLEITIPMELMPIEVKGKLKWIKELENDFIGSMELTEVMDDAKWAKLS